MKPIGRLSAIVVIALCGGCNGFDRDVFIQEGRISARDGVLMRVTDEPLAASGCHEREYPVTSDLIVMQTNGSLADTSSLVVGVRVAIVGDVPSPQTGSCPTGGRAREVHLR